MDTSVQPTTLRVAEAIYHVSDLNASLTFYAEVLGATKLWNFGEDMAGVSLQGLYHLALVPARWDKDWQDGQPVPAPLLSIESRGDFEANVGRLRVAGLFGEISGDTGTMLAAHLTDPFGNPLLVWQDISSAYIAPTLEPADGPYQFVELLLFVDDLPAAKRVYESLGFAELLSHGDAYTAYTLGSALPVGLMSWRHWFDTPAGGQPPAAPRLALECADIAAEHARLVAAGAEPEPLKGSAVGLEWFTLRDPDGNPLTFWQFQRGADQATDGG